MKTLSPFLLASLLCWQALAQTTALTDQEQIEANNYYHSGLADKVITDGCKQLKQGCTPTDNSSFMEMVLPKLYAVMGTLAAAGGIKEISEIKMKPKPDAKPATGEKADAKSKDSKSDLCIYIPMAGEAVSAFYQQSNENQIAQQQSQTLSDQQKENLYAVARVHDTRSKSASMQGGIYAATGACYVAYMAMGADMTSPGLWLKMGAASAMSMIFFNKAKNEKKYANEVRAIAAKIPGPGDCNPITQTNCFCAESTSATTDPTNYRKYCMPAALASGASTSNVGCSQIDSNGTVQLDPSCDCEKTNTCVSGQLSGLAAQLGVGAISLDGPLQALDATQGDMNTGTIEGMGTKLNALTQQALTKSGVANIAGSMVGSANKEVTQGLQDLGIPGNVAAGLSSVQGNGNGSAFVSAPTPTAPGVTPTSANAEVNAKAVNTGYNAAGGMNRGNGSGGQDGFVNPFAALGAKEKKNSAIQIETYANKAMAEAEIVKDTSTPIFQLISNRYRTSAWDRFNVMEPIPVTPATTPAPAPKN